VVAVKRKGGRVVRSGIASRKNVEKSRLIFLEDRLPQPRNSEQNGCPKLHQALAVGYVPLAAISKDVIVGTMWCGMLQAGSLDLLLKN
jgi:hypothetical protein